MAIPQPVLTAARQRAATLLPDQIELLSDVAVRDEFGQRGRSDWGDPLDTIAGRVTTPREARVQDAGKPVNQRELEIHFAYDADLMGATGFRPVGSNNIYSRIKDNLDESERLWTIVTVRLTTAQRGS